MADNVDDDICSYIGNSNSTSANSLKHIDLTQSNHLHHHQHHHHRLQHHHHEQQLSDAEHINNGIPISAEVSV